MKRISTVICVVTLVFVGIIGLLYVTDSSVQCPAFDKKMVSWFPYSKCETLTFVSRGNQVTEKVFFDSMRVQHKSVYDSELKCGTCGDLIEAVFRIGKDTLSVSIESGDPMFAHTAITNLNGLYPVGIKEQSADMLLSWADSLSPSGITQVFFKKKQGLIWFERGKQKFYRVKKDSILHYDAGQLAINEVLGCQ